MSCYRRVADVCLCDSWESSEESLEWKSGNKESQSKSEYQTRRERFMCTWSSECVAPRCVVHGTKKREWKNHGRAALLFVKTPRREAARRAADFSNINKPIWVTAPLSSASKRFHTAWKWSNNDSFWKPTIKTQSLYPECTSAQKMALPSSRRICSRARPIVDRSDSMPPDSASFTHFLPQFTRWWWWRRWCHRLRDDPSC